MTRSEEVLINLGESIGGCGWRVNRVKLPMAFDNNQHEKICALVHCAQKVFFLTLVLKQCDLVQAASRWKTALSYTLIYNSSGQSLGYPVSICLPLNLVLPISTCSLCYSNTHLLFLEQATFFSNSLAFASVFSA